MYNKSPWNEIIFLNEMLQVCSFSFRNEKWNVARGSLAGPYKFPDIEQSENELFVLLICLFVFLQVYIFLILSAFRAFCNHNVISILFQTR